MVNYLLYPEKQKVVIPYNQAAHNLMPHSQKHTVKGRDILVVPHRNSEFKLLKNLGIQIPAPILHNYKWPGPEPFKAQVKTAELLTTSPRAYVLNDMGTGKTLAALHAANFLMQQGDIRKALIIAPLSTLRSVWEDEIFKYFHNRSSVVLYKTKAQRMKRLYEDHDFYIINHDGVHSLRDELRERGDIDLLIVDELAAYRNARTRRWKALNYISRNRRFIWGLTGSPTPNGPPDAWAQCRLLTPETVPKYFKQWRTRTMIQINQFKWVPKRDSLEEVHKCMQPSVRYSRDDCMDLPPTVFSNRTAELDPDQKRIYKEVVKKLRLEFQEGKVTVANAGVKQLKLLQVVCGFLYTTDKKAVNFGCRSRLLALKESIEETPNKTIVFVPFIEALHNVAEYVKGFTTAEVVSGNTPEKDRMGIFARFQNSQNPRLLVAHPRCMAHGLTLTAADTIVWFAPLADLEIYDQANARVTRPGQKHTTLVVNIVGSKIEEKIYSGLRNKQKVQTTLLDMFANGLDV